MTTHRLGVDTPLGPLTVLADGDAIVAINWEICAEPRPSAVLEHAAEQLQAYFTRRRRGFDLSLAPTGSDFQRAVWKTMSAIPYGETRTYGDLARDIGSAPRAVGAACGRNPIPIIIPCHRVLGTGGKLTGYSGGKGLEAKSFLLRHENAFLPLFVPNREDLAPSSGRA